MSTESHDGMPDAQRRELVLALESVAALVEEARQCLLDGDDLLAITPLDMIRKGLLPIRNGIGQWHDRLICPNCGLEGRNIVAVRQGQVIDDNWSAPVGVADVGFRCQHCEKEWGFSVLTT